MSTAGRSDACARPPGQEGVTVTETRTFTFAGTRGDRLAGRLDLPDGKPRAVVLIAHRFSGGNAGVAAPKCARSFTELGMAGLSLDFAGDAGEEPGRAAFGLAADDLAADDLAA